MAHVAVTVGGAVPVEGAVTVGGGVIVGGAVPVEGAVLVEEAAPAPSLIDYSQFLMGIEGDIVQCPFESNHIVGRNFANFQIAQCRFFFIQCSVMSEDKKVWQNFPIEKCSNCEERMTTPEFEQHSKYPCAKTSEPEEVRLKRLNMLCLRCGRPSHHIEAFCPFGDTFLGIRKAISKNNAMNSGRKAKQTSNWIQQQEQDKEILLKHGNKSVMTVNSRLTEVKAMVDSVVIPNGPDLVYCLEVIAIQACIDKVHAVKTQLENLKAPVRIVFLVAKKKLDEKAVPREMVHEFQYKKTYVHAQRALKCDQAHSLWLKLKRQINYAQRVMELKKRCDKGEVELMFDLMAARDDPKKYLCPTVNDEISSTIDKCCFAFAEAVIEDMDLN